MKSTDRSYSPASRCNPQARLACRDRPRYSQIVRTAVNANIPCPLRMRHRLPVTTHRRIRTAHSRVRIAITCARRGHIDGKHQRGTARRFGALQRVTHKAAIAQHVQLEPHWALDGGRDFFNRANGHGRKGKGSLWHLPQPQPAPRRDARTSRTAQRAQGLQASTASR